VFPRWTHATPDDALVRIGSPTLWDQQNPPDSVRVSVSWTWDREKAEQIAGDWSMLCDDVWINGPAYSHRGGDFWPGMYVKHGYTITSRGCPNTCWFCRAWKVEGKEIRELPIMPGYNVLDNNLLACSRRHIESVFRMLEGQPKRPHFSGGLEAARLEGWHVDWFTRLKPKVMWFAYDTANGYEPLEAAARQLREAGLMGAQHRACCYVLAGWNREGRIDTLEAAEARVLSVVGLGYFPQAMVLDDGRDWPDRDRRKWKEWAAPWINKRSVGKRMKEVRGMDGVDVVDWGGRM